jgi:lysophospholipase L1-like esterase
VRSATAISTDYLQRGTHPASRFHADYLAYKRREITRKQLVARLPHVAMIGDSLSRNVYVSSALSTFWRARRHYGNDWFLNTDPSPSNVYSVFERLDKLTPIVATEYGGLGAMVDNGRDGQNFFRKILRTRNFSGQVTQLLSRERFPDLILIWIGHNNVDWTWRCPPDELEQPEERLLRLSQRFREDYRRQIRRLIERAQMKQHRVAIVAYGLVDFELFFKARAIAESLRERDPKLYPYLGIDCEYLVSMRPAYRENLIRLVRMVNEELRAMVRELDSELKNTPNVRVQYSDALARADVSRAEVLHAVDGWHASVAGHNIFAEAAFSALAPSLKFLEIEGDSHLAETRAREDRSASRLRAADCNNQLDRPAPSVRALG